MAPLSSCPRCQTVVSYEEGTKPRCHNCGYPGADTRASEAPGEPSGWTPHESVAPVVETTTSGKAVAALVLGIASYVGGGFVTAIVGLILAVSARKEIEASGGAVEGLGMATAGFWLSLVNLILGAIVLVVVLFVLGAGITAAGSL